MTKIAMKPRTFKASSGLSRLRYHLSPHTFFVVVVFILSLSVVNSYSFVQYCVGIICFLERKKVFQFVVFFSSFDFQLRLGLEVWEMRGCDCFLLRNWRMCLLIPSFTFLLSHYSPFMIEQLMKQTRKKFRERSNTLTFSYDMVAYICLVFQSIFFYLRQIRLAL